LSDSLRATPDSEATSPPASPAPPAPAEPELPAWLAGLRAPADEAEEAPADLAEPEPPARAGALPPWLTDVEPRQVEPPIAPVAPGSPAAAVPPWLHDVAMPTDLEAAPPAPAPAPSNIPPWLAGLTDETEAPPAIPAAEQPESEAWEAGQREAAEPPAPEPPAPNVNLTDEIELPAWLRAAASAPTPTPLPTATWGQEAVPAEPAPEPAAAVPTEPETVGTEAAAAEGELVLPDWIEEPPTAEVPAEVPALPTAEEPPATAAADVPAPVPAEPATTGAIAEGELPTSSPEPPTPGDQPGRAAGSGILFPAWLNELSTAPEAEATPAPGGESGLVSEEDLPAWLRALQPEARPAPPPAPVPPIVPLPAPAPAAEQLPEWLQALSGSTPIEEEIAVEETPASLAEALRAATPGRVVRARPPRAGAVETFTRLLNPPAPVVTPAPVPTRRQQMMAWLFPDRLVYAVLLLAVVAMWAILRTPAIAPNPALAAPNAEARAFHALIAPGAVVTRSLGTGGVAAPLPRQPVTTTTGLTATAVLSPALVVYDWDASRYGEMHELSRAVTRDLLSNGRPFASVSLLPQGPGFADQVVNEVGDDPEFHMDLLSLPKNGGQYGVRYLNLGWRTGNEAAIHSLVSDPQGVLNARGPELSYDYRHQNALSTYPLIQQTPTLSQYGVVILLVSDENDLRLWLEQLTSQVGVPVIAAVPVSLRAGVAPYLDPALAGLSPARLRGAIFGVQGASQLEQLRLGSRAVSTAEQIRQGRWLHTLSVALLVVAALLLLGFLGGIYRWSTRPRQ
jgi:hypothetical protein